MGTFAWMALSLACAVAAFALLGLRIAFPHHRKLALGVWALGWIPLAVSALEHRPEVEATVEASGVVMASVVHGHGLHLALAAVLLFVGYLVRVLFPVHRGAAPELDETELTLRVDDDLAHLSFLFERVEGVTRELVESGIHAPAGQVPSAEDDARLRTLWALFLEATFELDVLKSQYRSFYSLNPVTQREIHARCFLVAYGAYVAAYRAGTLVTRWVGEDAVIRTILDEANPRYDLPEDTYLALQRQSAHPDTLVRLSVGRAYLKVHEERLREQPVWVKTKKYLADLEDVLDAQPQVFADNPLDYLERVAFDLWFPIQKTLTRGLSAVHVPMRDHYVSTADLRAVASQLQPGDILLTRREWHLTNLGIPGYWTHASVYTGTLAQLDAFTDEPVSERIAQRLPDVFAALQTPDEAGHAVCVIEAVTKGVRLSSLEVGGSADAFAVLRPTVPKAERVAAVLEALEHVGKPYDYNFDLATDNALFCSELVHEAYHAVSGVEFEPELVNGRLMLSPNAICEKLVRDDGQLEFVLFLDGLDQGHVETRDADALRASCARPKWHILVAE